MLALPPGAPVSAATRVPAQDSTPAGVHAMCEDYRAAASIDLEHDKADLDKKIACPVDVLWADGGAMAKLYDVLAIWRERARDVSEGHCRAATTCKKGRRPRCSPSCNAS